MPIGHFHPKRPLLLATDLDGTFVGGSPEDRHALYELITANRQSVRLLFCTGRSLRKVHTLSSAYKLPAPDAMICDVGSSVFDSTGQTLFDDLQEDIVRRWGDGQVKVADALADLPLTLQDETGPCRRSYLYEEESSAREAQRRVESLGFDGLLSDNLYFDALPRGVNKGTTLLQVVQRFGFAPTDVLVAGDTLNDLSMLACGLPAVAVVNAEPRLLQALPQSPAIYRASRPGAAGILEAIACHPALN